jgi:hypothetical protein
MEYFEHIFVDCTISVNVHQLHVLIVIWLLYATHAPKYNDVDYTIVLHMNTSNVENYQLTHTLSSHTRMVFGINKTML